MIRADDGTSICDPENLLLDQAEFIDTDQETFGMFLQK
jgi:hypothetical protein